MVGLSVSLPSTVPTRTQPIGPSNGAFEMCSAADAAFTARMSYSFSWSADHAETTICTSFRKPFGQSGRMGRSTRRAVRMPSSEGRPSRRGNEPGILPAAYRRSSKSTVSGKKSMP